MVTNYPQQLTGSRLARVGERQQDETWLGRLVETIRQALCSLKGHDSVLHFEQNKVLLRCTSCGYDSPGWDIGHKRPRRVFHGDAERHLLRRGPIALRRPA